MSRIYNFSAGPAMLPPAVLKQVQEELVDYQGEGMSLMEMSHRGKPYMAVHAGALQNVRELMGLGEDHSVLFLQGGATGQFAMIPMNLLPEGRTADYVNCGAWATKAINEARCIGNVHVAADTAKDNPTRMPSSDEMNFSGEPAYLHLTSNETISGAQMKDFPKVDAPLVVDMSSDILSRELDFSSFGLIYAGAQKNLGPSGLTLVVIRNDLADRVGDHVPPIYRYKSHIEADSMLNTPPCFGVYILKLVTDWIKEQGGVAAVEKINVAKAGRLYQTIDGTDFYSGTAVHDYRSDMNVTFRLQNEDLEGKFISEATAQGLSGLKGHRSFGGIRASIYNAMPDAGVDALINFMNDFEKTNG